jgi:4-hydroxybenzoate polyprenyltransferase
VKNRLQNYIELTRLNKPIGIWLLFLPCLFGIALALKEIAVPLEALFINKIILLFFAGSVVMRSAGCVINDLFDEKFDKKVERTKNRPIASGKVSRRESFALLGFLLFLGLIILLQLNFPAILGGFFALVLVIAYPLTKRITYYPQLFLGLTFNFGILMSSLLFFNAIDLNFIILYFAGIIWTIIYDTIYAFQDIEDDLRIGVKSTAIKFKSNPKKILISLNLAMFLTLIFLGLLNQFSPIFFLIISCAAIFSSEKIKKCDLTNSANCLKVFKSNLFLGLLILTAIIFG